MIRRKYSLQNWYKICKIKEKIDTSNNGTSYSGKDDVL